MTRQFRVTMPRTKAGDLNLVLRTNMRKDRTGVIYHTHRYMHTHTQTHNHAYTHIHTKFKNIYLIIRGIELCYEK